MTLCADCDRELTDPRSIARGRGPCCFGTHLEKLSENDRFIERVREYRYFKRGDVYYVVSPRRAEDGGATVYQCDPERWLCDCMAWGRRRTCVHLDYLAWKLSGEVKETAPETPARRKLTPEDVRRVEREILTLF